MPIFICDQHIQIAKNADFCGIRLPKCDTLWTDSRTISACNAAFEILGYAPDAYLSFRRIGEGLTRGESQRLVGHTLVLGRQLSNSEREELRCICLKMPEFSHVKSTIFAPRWIECCIDARFPKLRTGDKGVYVFALQDALRAKGYTQVALTGVFDCITERAIASMYRGFSGVVHREVWRLVLT